MQLSHEINSVTIVCYARGMDNTTGLRESKKLRTRRQLAATALELFLERGFDAVSVADVAAAAEVSKPTLFRYFPSKEDLVLDRFADHQDEVARIVRDRGRAGRRCGPCTSTS